ncbi:bifunctional serine/threonine-protein kinase/formylglycine-generating enzyme family protein [Cerasicoccus fimbriatus]|uniref:bifunctional serine/threonine-protein kinase/formylglycine-generating enzyme family protein n=1 Tax=Cerasicoccus fimbriatus TaxID=3014554 RepID=UPI0022B517B1|nr:bifunctional serine/threonine-protein kinase/formylglycine-generating enzyme family protein [Cerasicoccus sp. TK19100]
MNATAKLTNGLTVFDRYRLKRLLGRGGMGVVWLAHDIELEKDIALKFLTENLLFDSAAIKDLKKETRRGMELAHPNIIRVYGFFSGDDRAAVAMEYVEGNNLSTLRDTRHGSYFEVAEIASLTMELCSALHYAHSNAEIVHRDLKPANLMVDQKNRLKVADFGISSSLNDAHTRLTGTMGLRGTMLYMGPQQLMGQRPCISHDIYGLGATLFDLLTGKPVFYTGDISLQIRESMPPSIQERRTELEIIGEEIPPAWEDTIAACLAKDAADRPSSAAEVINRLCLTEGLANSATPFPMPMSGAYSSGPAAPTIRDAGDSIELSGRNYRHPPTAQTTVKEPTDSANTQQPVTIQQRQSPLSGLVLVLLVLCSVAGGGAIAYLAFHQGSHEATIKANASPLANNANLTAGPGPSGLNARPTPGGQYPGPPNFDTMGEGPPSPNFGPGQTINTGMHRGVPEGIISTGITNRAGPDIVEAPRRGYDFKLQNTGMVFRWAPPFRFQIGSPAHRVGDSVNDSSTLVDFTQGFWICQHEVTQHEYEKFMGMNPSENVHGKHPVENVSWSEAMAFCAKLNEVYASQIPEGYTFSLPTQAQFEYASLGAVNGYYGQQGRFERFAWNSVNSEMRSHPVGELEPNEFQLYDTVGNVSEWTLDWYGPLPGGEVKDFAGPETGEAKVVRGGNYTQGGSDLRVSVRESYPPETKDPRIGFRVALIPITFHNSPEN